MQKEKNIVSVQLDQSSRRLIQLEDEKKNADQSLKRTQGLLDDRKGKLVVGLAMTPDVLDNYFMYYHLILWQFALQLNQKDRPMS